VTRAPRNRKLSRAARYLAAGQFALDHERVIYLGLNGEVLDGGPPETVVETSTKKAHYLGLEQLGAVLYLGKSEPEEDDLVMAVVEVVESASTRSTHVWFTTLEEGTWLHVSDDYGDKWVKSREGSDHLQRPSITEEE